MTRLGRLGLFHGGFTQTRARRRRQQLGVTGVKGDWTGVAKMKTERIQARFDKESKEGDVV